MYCKCAAGSATMEFFVPLIAQCTWFTVLFVHKALQTAQIREINNGLCEKMADDLTLVDPVYYPAAIVKMNRRATGGAGASMSGTDGIAMGGLGGGGIPTTYPYGANVNTPPSAVGADMAEMGGSGFLMHHEKQTIDYDKLSNHHHPFGAGSVTQSVAHAYSQSVNVGPTASFICLAGLLCFIVLPANFRCAVFILTICALGTLFAFWLSRFVLSKDDGSAEMRAVATPIREGAEGFLRVQYSAIAKIAVVLSILITLSYMMRPEGGGGNHGVGKLGNTMLGLLGSISFILGALCSAAAGYLSMWVAAHTNVRVTSAARRSYMQALIVCFNGGAFSAVLDITLCVAGVTCLYLGLYLVFVPAGVLHAGEVPMLMVGYGFGASFVALFMQLGGGIYTKAADVGADLVGKVEQGIPEDDPRNPAVIADLVGDMVGDCVGSSSDVFESVAAEIIGAMILGSTLAKEAGLTDPTPFMFFPLVVHALDIVVSSLGIMYVGSTSQVHAKDPMNVLKGGYYVTATAAAVGFVFTCWLLLSVPDMPQAWLHFAGCGALGMLTSYIFIASTQYYTDYEYYPVRSIAEASTTGHGTNIITGVAVGMKSTAVPSLTVSFSVIAAYHLGRTSGIGIGHNAGLFGTAVATMGMLSSACYVLSMNNYGPIADNAGGIAEMSQQPEFVRESTDRLDAAGNVTKAITKGYSIGSASLACFLLFGAFMDEFSQFSGKPFRVVDIAVPEVLIGGIIGTMMVFYFVGLTVAAVGKTAGEVVKEVRRQFRDNPEIMTFKARPDYRSCVALVTHAALKEMVWPGLLATGLPIVVGVVFRGVGAITDRSLLGAEVLAGYLMFGTVTGIMMALFLDNVGGAWDNAKKYIELGHHGGKNSEAHKAAVTGDTVGDPFKDTAGPALHVVIKLLSTTVLVLGPLFIN
ncbi:pyrophosphate-energized membrane proton pump 2 [Nannochloropsis gaditana]|uniref:H(+)-exporting diphosphatase n=1 Tax=Nannochloropsis gaditana TaxID=72520 RepID=W7T9J2_9STRA|nr:pyrophosphate-energized membrane proton pump 2 [Nannochloropsis gaditana]